MSHSLSYRPIIRAALTVPLCLPIGLLLSACGASTSADSQAVDTVEVRPRVSGYINQLLFREGQLVKKDDLLFVIDPRPYQADYDRARAGVALAKAQRELASIELARVQKLKQSGVVSQEELDERLSTFSQQGAAVAASQAALDGAALNLSFTNVRAPMGHGNSITVSAIQAPFTASCVNRPLSAVSAASSGVSP
jgi:RND family efflux transporter MFP subunit